MAKNFRIGKFPEEKDDIAVVPSNWIVGDKCLWPPRGKNIGKYVSKRKEPDPETWKSCPVVLFSKIYDSYELAVEDLHIAEVSSDLDVASRSKRRQKTAPSLPAPPQFSLIGSNEDQEEEGPAGNSYVRSQSAESSMTREFLSQSNKSSTIKALLPQSGGSSIIGDQDGVNLELNPSSILPPPNDHSSFILNESNVAATFYIVPGKDTDQKATQTDPYDLQHVINMLVNIKFTMREHTDALAVLLGCNNEQRTTGQPKLSGRLDEFELKISNDKIFIKLNDLLEEAVEAKSDLKIILSSAIVGVSVLDEAVKRMLGKVMTDELQSKYSLKGMRGKLNFSKHLGIKDVIKGILREHPVMGPICGDGDIDSAISDSLKKAADRVYQRTKKLAARQETRHDHTIR